jgi:hypothetical protein
VVTYSIRRPALSSTIPSAVERRNKYSIVAPRRAAMSALARIIKSFSRAVVRPARGNFARAIGV